MNKMDETKPQRTEFTPWGVPLSIDSYIRGIERGVIKIEPRSRVQFSEEEFDGAGIREPKKIDYSLN